MQVLIVYSKRDPAGKNIAKQLRKLHEFNEGKSEKKRIVLLSTRKEIVQAHVPKKISTDLVIFASKHKSVAGKPCLTVHAPGNFGNAELGGLPGKLCTAPAVQMTLALVHLHEEAKRLGLEGKYQVCFEATHHGPYTNVPCFFIEIGSSDKEWNDEKASEAIANAVMASITREEKMPAALGVGGPHYSAKFTKVALGGRAVGHIIPKYALPSIDKKMITQAMVRTTPKPEIVFVDWKGLGKEKRRILDIIERLNIRCERV
jgi:D-aminoacyl-tRNA deacylase